MRKYKLIKEYPGSVPLNTEATETPQRAESGIYYYKSVYQQNGTFVEEFINNTEVENFPDFWQLIEEKDNRVPTKDEVIVTINQLVMKHGSYLYWEPDAYNELYDQLCELFKTKS